MGTLQCAYWIEAIEVAQHATIFNGKAYWRSGGPGSFLPWPKQPGLLTVMTPMTDPTDQLIFYLIRTWLYIVIAVGMVALFGYLGWRIGKTRKAL